MEFYESLVLPKGPRGSFPVIVGHCVASLVSWRTYEEAQNALELKERKDGEIEVVSPLYPIVAGYFCYGYGGGLIRDWVMGQVPIAFTNKDILIGWMYGWVTVYHTNGIVYNACKSSAPFNPLKAIVLALDAIDSAGGVCSSCEKGARLFPDNPHAPFVSGMLLSIGGSIFRYIEQKSRGKNPRMEWARPTAVFKRGLAYTLSYMTLKHYRGSRFARLTVISLHLFRVLIMNTMKIEIFPFLN